MVKGIAAFLFDRQHWDEYYLKNCSLKTTDEWYDWGERNIPLGMLYASLGLFCLLFYIPFMIAMLKPEFIQHSCYKFMFLIGLIDMIVLPGNSIIAGIQCAFGIHFCVWPQLFFWAGAVATYGWYGVSMTCIVLAMDRFLEMCWPWAAHLVFGGKRIYFWLCFSVVYMFCSYTQVPFLYHTRKFIFSNDPYYEVEGMQGNPYFYQLTFHCIHNITVGFLLGGIYATLLIVLKIKSCIYKHVTITKMQKLLTLQAMCICIEMFIAAIVYVYNQFFPLPSFIEIIAQVSWIGVHGDTPIVYLLLNASLRKAVFKMLKNRRITFSTIGPMSKTKDSRIPTRDSKVHTLPSGETLPPLRNELPKSPESPWAVSSTEETSAS